MHTRTELTHIGNINPGDTIEHDGQLLTVGRHNIKRCGFMGITLFGDSYRAGSKKVKRVVIIKAMPADAIGAA